MARRPPMSKVREDNDKSVYFESKVTLTKGPVYIQFRVHGAGASGSNKECLILCHFSTSPPEQASSPRLKLEFQSKLNLARVLGRGVPSESGSKSNSARYVCKVGVVEQIEYFRPKL